jgi:hypothetical protein
MLMRQQRQREMQATQHGQVRDFNDPLPRILDLHSRCAATAPVMLLTPTTTWAIGGDPQLQHLMPGAPYFPNLMPVTLSFPHLIPGTLEFTPPMCH